jgi:hypothetical protein
MGVSTDYSLPPHSGFIMASMLGRYSDGSKMTCGGSGRRLSVAVVEDCQW